MTKYYLVSEEDLPETFHRILRVRQRLREEEGLTVSRACREEDLSRSAFYKYRDSLLPYEEKPTSFLHVELRLERQLSLLHRIRELLAQEEVYLRRVSELDIRGGQILASYFIEIDKEKRPAYQKALEESLRSLQGLRSWELSCYN